jgi:CheY-like chemotaxis protein
MEQGRSPSPPQDSPDQAWALALEGTGAGDERLTRCVADHFGLDVADTANVSPGAARLIPGGVLEKFGVVPLRCTDAELVVATADPSDTGDANRELSNLSGRRVVFEVASPSAIRESRLQHAPPEPPSRSVLVVDDDRSTRVLLRKVLETVGFEVEEAENGAEALELLKEGHGFDLVTLDLYMDDVHGLDVLERLRANEKTANLPILVATASNDPAMQMKVLDAGADDFVTKPLDATRFVLRVRAVLRRHEKRGLGHLV